MSGKLPRSLNGSTLIRGLRRVGYVEIRTVGDHVQMQSRANGTHQTTVPLHNPIKVGTLSAIISGVCRHLGINRDELFRRMKI